jgi:hypothetical protein
MKFFHNTIIPGCQWNDGQWRVPVSFLKLPDIPEGNDYDISILTEDEPHEKFSEDDRFICCAQCLQPITRVADKITMQGMHHHTFANPQGIVFEIGCFREAMGCRNTGFPTTEFTWFPGYAWRIAVCKKCMLHLGWMYAATGKESFFGLIVNRLLYPDKS